MGKSKTKSKDGGWLKTKTSRSFTRYYRVQVGVDGDEFRKLSGEKLQFLMSCPALIAIDFDPWVYAADGEKWTAEIKFRDLEKPKCEAVVAALGLEVQSARGRMW